MKKITLSLLFTAALIVVSCSKSDDTPTTYYAITDYSTETAVSGKFQRNVLIEDYTGAWCGWCPRVAYAISLVEAQGIRAVPVAIHNGDAMAWGSSSTWPQPVNSFPTAMINRTIQWSTPENNNVKQVQRLNGNNCDLGLAVSSTINGSSMDIEVKMKFAADFTDLKLVAYVLEDNIASTQANYTSFYGGTSSISGFDNDHVLRACLTNIQGDAITGTTSNGQTITKTFSVNVPSNISNVANMNFVAFVIGSNNKVINVRGALPGENQQLEQNQ
jgi:hypothetical protein